MSQAPSIIHQASSRDNVSFNTDEQKIAKQLCYKRDRHLLIRKVVYQICQRLMIFICLTSALRPVRAGALSGQAIGKQAEEFTYPAHGQQGPSCIKPGSPRGLCNSCRVSKRGVHLVCHSHKPDSCQFLIYK